MTYLWVLRLLQRVVHWAEARTGWWIFTDWHGHIAFRQIDYAKRVQKASGWEPVEIVNRPSGQWVVCEPTVTTRGTNVNVTWRS